MKTIEEILMDYTKGESTMEEANAELEKAGSSLQLNPSRNMFTAGELLETRVGNTPAEANGWGIMDHGIGNPEKVHVVDGRTPDVNMGEETAFVYIAGRKYRLLGDTLANPEV